ncbi:tensin-3 [Grus japonensis]|uniref:Tensin-3 n=1 Tax=Grus japonensis TaxID=30415 RepID=A0ABC9WFK2_GRUJA
MPAFGRSYLLRSFNFCKYACHRKCEEKVVTPCFSPSNCKLESCHFIEHFARLRINWVKCFLLQGFFLNWTGQPVCDAATMCSCPY